MEAEPRFWIAIPVHNRVEMTRSCLLSLRRQRYQNYRVVVCDDGSADGTAEVLATEFPEAVVLYGDGNLWWTGATNECVKYILEHADADDYLITLNNDLEVADDYLGMMARALAEKPDAILASASYDIAYPDTLIEAGERIDWLRARARRLNAAQYNYSGLAEITHAPGRGTVFPLRVFSSIGLFDHEGLPQYGADYDFTHRARRAGYRIYMNYDAKLYSHVDHTGSTAFKGRWSFRRLYGYLTSIKSPGCLKYRWRFARRNCPSPLLPSYIVLDTARVVGSYLLKRKWR